MSHSISTSHHPIATSIVLVLAAGLFTAIRSSCQDAGTPAFERAAVSTPSRGLEGNLEILRNTEWWKSDEAFLARTRELSALRQSGEIRAAESRAFQEALELAAPDLQTDYCAEFLVHPNVSVSALAGRVLIQRGAWEHLPLLLDRLSIGTASYRLQLLRAIPSSGHRAEWTAIARSAVNLSLAQTKEPHDEDRLQVLDRGTRILARAPNATQDAALLRDVVVLNPDLPSAWIAAYHARTRESQESCSALATSIWNATTGDVVTRCAAGLMLLETDPEVEATIISEILDFMDEYATHEWTGAALAAFEGNGTDSFESRMADYRSRLLLLAVLNELSSEVLVTNLPKLLDDRTGPPASIACQILASRVPKELLGHLAQMSSIPPEATAAIFVAAQRLPALADTARKLLSDDVFDELAATAEADGLSRIAKAYSVAIIS